MVRDLPIKRLIYKDLTIEGYSRAAVQTYWRVGELNVAFDAGAHPWMFMGTPNLFISHTHLDHLVMLPSYVARRRMMKMTPPRIFLPCEMVDKVAHMLKLWAQLDQGSFACELIGMKDGQRVELSREVFVEAWATVHRIPSLGYVVYNRRKKLKPEFLSLSGEQILQLKESGVEIQYELRFPRVAYLGDSNPAGLDRNEIFYESEVLIMEMTFVEPRHQQEKIHRYGHIHLEDVIQRREKFKNELIIASHFTARSTAEQVRRNVEKKIPDMLDGRLKLWI
ncbi:MAG: MBL fold metallo-hydrolase [Planctomycetia bacterium]|nr:MBL fold metallo-hydrolase [Planctomycetia bacterium]